MRNKKINFDSSEMELNLLKKLIVDASDGVHVLDQEGEVVFCSSVFADMLGYSLSEASSLNVRDWDRKFPQEELTSIIKDLIESPKVFETKHLKKDGGLLDVEINARGIEINGEYYLYASSRDITEKLKQRKFDQHQAKMASIGELSAGVGHEINNPLAIIKSYLISIQTKCKRYNSIDQETLLNFIGKIDLAADRIARIVKGLRTFARDDSSQDLNFSASEALDETYSLIAEIYSKEGIELNLNSNSSLSEVMVYGNRGKFQQVLMNILSNARDALYSSKSKKININCITDEDSFIIEVEDNGLGIPPAIIHNIFDPFFTTKDVNKGTGIGLSIVHNYISEMNGSVDVESPENKGAKFTIELPISSRVFESKGVVEASECESSLPRDLSLLLVDDEEEIRELLGEILREEGFKVETAENGKVALDIYLNSKDGFDFVISDMKMPVMDGAKLLKEIRGNSKIKQPLFIFFTGGVNTDFESEASELKGLYDGYFYKPFQPEDILDVMTLCYFRNEKSKAA